ncbi:MAG TPA: nucleotidyltransferase family protein [Candidatus Limnocylindrales bacterium]|nr:nucleotidyltransferase family protein [Candidatus Limnocylindrales bacterium]
MQLSADDITNISRIAQKHGAVKVSLFGSFARGDAQPSSDVDILVEFESGRTLLDLIRLERELEELLNTGVDVLTPNSLHPRIRERVMKETVPVL